MARCSSSSSETLAGSLPRLLGGGRVGSSAASSFAVTLRARLAARCRGRWLRQHRQRARHATQHNNPVMTATSACACASTTARRACAAYTSNHGGGAEGGRNGGGGDGCGDGGGVGGVGGGDGGGADGEGDRGGAAGGQSRDTGRLSRSCSFAFSGDAHSLSSRPLAGTHA